MIGTKIKFFRESKNLKREWLAEQINISESQLNRIENNKSEITVQRLVSIAKLLEISVYDFFGDEVIQDSAPQLHQKYGTVGSAFIRQLLHQHEIDIIKNKELQEMNEKLLGDLSVLNNNLNRLMDYVAETKRNETKRNETKRNETKRKINASRLKN